jgi:LmbE family N-acetylglucosaminyl deacetylase
MKKIIFGIFAHPDDEAFGPAGTLLMETKSGTELHLITLTAGENGVNIDNHDNLGEIRLQEWRKAADIIGATKTYHLDFSDGHLDNTTMIDAATIIEKIVTDVTTADDITEIEFMTLDPNGVTGHIDHIVACRAACLVFYRLKSNDSRLTRIRFACLPRKQIPVAQTDWIYMDAGRADNEIDEVIDARSLRDEIITIMRCHATQTADCESALERQGDNLGLDHFIVSS